MNSRDQVPESELRIFADTMCSHYHKTPIIKVIEMARAATSSPELLSIYDRLLQEPARFSDHFAEHAAVLPADFLQTIDLFWSTGDARYFSYWRNPHAPRIRDLVERHPAFFDFKAGDDPLESAAVKLDSLINQQAHAIKRRSR